MSVSLGFILAFLGGGILAALVPILNMAVRSENYTGLSNPPLQILLDANWQMMAMLNVLLIVCGACMMYHTEYTDNAMQKMKSLPMKESGMFCSKLILLSLMLVIVLLFEAAALTMTSLHWFNLYDGFWLELAKNFGYLLFMSLPSVILSLVISSACKNMWVSLGIGVVCVFTATMLPVKSFVLSLFPFALPFQTFVGTSSDRVMQYIVAAIIEVVIIEIAELVFLKVRRAFE
jgi:hypothetical protein